MKRSKAELLNIVERIVNSYTEGGLTIQQIEESLKADGYDISREAIRRTVKKNKTIAKELEKARNETGALIDLIREKPSTDVNEAIVDFLIAKVFEFTKSIEGVEFSDLPELAQFIQKISRVKIDIVKTRMDYQKVYERAKEDILKELQEALGGNPIWEELRSIVLSLEAPVE